MSKQPKKTTTKEIGRYKMPLLHDYGNMKMECDGCRKKIKLKNYNNHINKCKKFKLFIAKRSKQIKQSRALFRGFPIT